MLPVSNAINPTDPYDHRATAASNYSLPAVREIRARYQREPGSPILQQALQAT